MGPPLISGGNPSRLDCGIRCAASMGPPLISGGNDHDPAERGYRFNGAAADQRRKRTSPPTELRQVSLQWGRR